MQSSVSEKAACLIKEMSSPCQCGRNELRKVKNIHSASITERYITIFILEIAKRVSTRKQSN